MKKLFIITILALTFVNAKAQFGITAGATISNFKFENKNSNVKNLLGLNIGIVNYFGEGKSQFKTGLIVTQKGYKVSNLNSPSYILRLNYVDIPLLYTRKFTEKIQLEIGPYIGIAINGYLKSDTPIKGLIGSTKDNLEFKKNGLQRLGGGVNLGLNYFIKENIQIGASYSYGLLDIDGGSSKLYNKYAKIGVSYFLN